MFVKFLIYQLRVQRQTDRLRSQSKIIFSGVQIGFIERQ